MKKYTSIEDLHVISESALESSLAGFWDWDMETNEEYLSPRFKSMLGYADHEMENSPEAWQKIAFQEDLPDMFESFNAHVASQGKVPFRSVVRYHHKDGSTVWVRCNGKVVEWSDSGAPLRAIGCHVDITEEKTLEEELKRAVREREVLLKEVHHRVKNNLQLLLSMSRLKDKNGTVYTHEIENSIKSIAGAYDAIYKSDRLDKVAIKSYLEKIINPLVQGQNAHFAIESVRFVENIDFLIPIGLIITELVNNSLKHGRINGHPLHLKVKIDLTESLLSIRYSDDGKGYGISRSNAMENVQSSGLSIVEGLIEQLNGEIEFYDDGGACTEMKIRLSS
ncbi:MAG: PAS domain-containing protein [bacterium]|nr:PAS domain-containing protein [bacterium]